MIYSQEAALLISAVIERKAWLMSRAAEYSSSQMARLMRALPYGDNTTGWQSNSTSGLTLFTPDTHTHNVSPCTLGHVFYFPVIHHGFLFYFNTRVLGTSVLCHLHHHECHLCLIVPFPEFI